MAIHISPKNFFLNVVSDTSFQTCFYDNEIFMKWLKLLVLH